ncbi:hypothetical protein [Cellulomonas septica]|uniref:hypothetical protein n=1 Tax=Cellulomonas septica TaxID=285080 RepID=UPI0031B61AEB
MRRPAVPVVSTVLLAVLAVLGAVAPAAAAVDPDVTGRLSLFKRIENLDTGASEGRRELWTMTAVSTEDPAYTFTGNGLNGIQSLVVPAGDYTIGESGGVPGYAFVSWDCGAAGTFTDPTPTVTVPADGTLTCTVRNDAIQPSLTLRKVVTGGPASPSAWDLTAQGPTTVTGPGTASGPVRIGEYQLSETGGPSGYTPGDWVCTGGTQTGPSSVVVSLAQDVECTVTNARSEPTPHLVTLRKEVVGGPATTADFLLSGTGPPGTVEGVSGSPTVTEVPVPSGTYTLTETPTTPAAQVGYTASAWSCTAGTVSGSTLTLADGDGDAVCTVTNTWTGGTLTLVKQVVGGALIPQAWTLSATGPVTASGVSGGPAVTGAQVPAGTYALAESGPTNYTASGWVCDGGGGGAFGTVEITAGADVTCTITNTIERGSLTLVKVVDNRAGGTALPGDFTLTAVDAPDGVVLSGPAGSPAVTRQAVDVGSSWALSEDGPPGYAAGPWTCDGAPVAADVVTVDQPADVVCTVVNTWSGAFLTLVKEVEGSSAPPAAWTLTATGPEATVSGVSGSPAATRVPVPAGAYTLGESTIAGFTASGWTCGAAPVAGDVVTLAAGDDVTCTVTNVATQPHLTLTKLVANDAGGTATPSQWTLSATGPTSFSGTTGTPAVTRVAITPGTYQLAESPATTPGYEASDWICQAGGVFVDAPDGVLVVPATAADGSPFTDDVRCAIVNSDVAPELTLVKQLDNRGGGPAQPTAFVLLAIGSGGLLVGSTGTVSVTDVPVGAGTYRLLEIGLTNYVSDGWACVDDAGGSVPVASDGSIALALGDDVTCTVTNRWAGAQLTLAKSVDGGPAAAQDWTLVASSPGGSSFSGLSGGPEATGVVVPGTYTLSEVARTDVAGRGYDLVAWDCGPDHPVVDRTVDLAANDEVTCTATNTWIGGTLTLQKVVVGGTAQPADFTLVATGPTGTWRGPGGSAAVRSIPVVPGVYRLAEGLDGPADYRFATWTCDSATVLGDVVIVDEGADVTCAALNVYAPPVDPPDPPQPPVPVDPTVPDASGGGGDAALATTGTSATGGNVGSSV